MATIRGTTKDRSGKPLSSVSVELKDESFQTVYTTLSDEEGHFTMTVPDATYPFLTAVRDYAASYLEYWAHNVPVFGCLNMDIEIDTLELYGLNAFEIKGAAPALTLYFRPMSLVKFQAQEKDIAPDFDPDGITVRIDGQTSEVFVVNRVKESIAPNEFLTAYLMQATLPENEDAWNRVDLRLQDREGHSGCATLFRAK